MKVLAVIPARGGSKGVHKKNLSLIGGKSLISRAISSAEAADYVLVTTDDIEIRDAALACGANAPFLRPIELSSDEATTKDTVKHAIISIEKILNVQFDLIVLLEPTSPFRTKRHVSAAIEKMKTGQYGSVVAICQLERKPQNIFVKNEFLSRYIQAPIEHYERRQEMNKLCRINSAIYVFDRSEFLKQERFIIEPIGWVEMNNEESVNIDSQQDLDLAKIIAKNRNL